MDDGSKKMFKPVNLGASAEAAQAIGQSSPSGKHSPHAAAAVSSERAPGPSTSYYLPAATFSTATSIARETPRQSSLNCDAIGVVHAGSRVIVSGIRAQPHLNGQLGTAVEFDSAEERWKVVMDDGSRKMFRPGSLTACEHMPAPVRADAEPRQATASCTREGGIATEAGGAPALTAIQPGSRVAVSGTGAPVRLHGQVGTAVEFDEHEDRWSVALDDGSQHRARRGGLARRRVRPPSAASPERPARHGRGVRRGRGAMEGGDGRRERQDVQARQCDESPACGAGSSCV
ncbi:unnamed protein product [Prorocentrum cordatum]|uniref:Uncharacterized protein n=1 Tax=Prorocentrum cordatum TaxID=2364126 RepID=A0ABN9PY78_9DINO|nr:unnamed protein product [Polarella glacialis]